MAIEGPLRELGIHDVFQLLDLSRKTGRLRVTSALRDNEGTVYFKEGRVISASVRSNPHPLGAVLLRAGKVAGDDLEAARALQQAPGESRRLGEILVAMGVITQRELDRQVRSTQIRLLEQAGVVVAPSNAQACELALALSANDVRVPRYANTQ